MLWEEVFEGTKITSRKTDIIINKSIWQHARVAKLNLRKKNCRKTRESIEILAKF